MLTGGNAICIEHVPDLPLMNCLECIGSVSLALVTLRFSHLLPHTAEAEERKSQSRGVSLLARLRSVVS
jgi:hypothetical protein